MQTNDAFLFICCILSCAFFMVVAVLVGANKAQARGRHKEKRIARLVKEGLGAGGRERGVAGGIGCVAERNGVF